MNDNKNNKYMRQQIILFAAAMLLTACNVKDPIYETAHPEHGRITLTTDWSGRGEGIDIPASHHVRANGDETGKQTFTAHTNDHPELFEPGTHRLHLYHDATGITVSGNTATVAAQAGNTRAGNINASPDWFFSAAMDVEIEADKVHPVTATMQQQVRELTLVIEPTGGTTDRISSITATLSGAAGTLDIDNGTHGSPSEVALTFTKGADGKWSATVRLLGIANGAAPRLTGTIAFAGDTPADIPLDSDLTSALAGFNTGKKTPLTLGGQVVEVPTGTGFTASITGWSTINKDGVIAD